ncbi:pathogenesis-related protein 1B-like [Mercurialis annua]|uniref:pathogenesis-related protein 1B-like n=1 Tax=Mercurialis annua TaxID=3986 RepID=UPI0024AEE032|nr:pathogenesis-related protein 1B-like [Mercurialis annua]
MIHFKFSLPQFYLIIILASSFIAYCIYAQNLPQDYLIAHNEARKAVNVGNLTWNNTLAMHALNYSNQRVGDCNALHSGGPYGENIVSDVGDLTAADAVNKWLDQKGYYDYNSNNCTSGHICNEYVQVVWRNTTNFGCAKVKCTTGGTLVTCNYDPPGNIAGQKPY